MNNVEMLRQAHQAFSAHDAVKAAKLVTSQCKVTDHGRAVAVNSRDEFADWLKAFYTMSSDIKLMDAEYIAAEDHVTARFRAVGTQDGPMAGTPFAASGKPFSLDVCEVWRFNEYGEAVEGHNYSDGLGLLIQLGHVQGNP